jgi:uncharacterized protein YaiE (UPF0345 family)
MQDWIQILVAFVQGDASYEFGTKSIEDMKVVTPQAAIEVQKDERWDDLLELGRVFAGSSV